MADFNQAYDITRKIEGGWHNASGKNRFDRGGETFKGIARKFWPKWIGWEFIDALKEESGFPHIAENNPALNQMVRDFFKKEFWDVNKLDQMPQPIANELFDTGVNIGVNPAARMLQRAINYLNRNGRSWKEIAIDGKIGPQTLAMVNRLGPIDLRHLFNLLNILQGAHYVGILDRDRTQEENIRGWMERVEIMR